MRYGIRGSRGHGRAGAHMARADYRAALADLRRVIELTDVPALRAGAQRDLAAVSGRLGLAADALALSPAKPLVYLHYNDQRDADVLKAIAASLSAYNVQGVELRADPTSGDVRYFYYEDRLNAEKVAKIVGETLRSRGARQGVQLQFLDNVSKRVARGVIEVWIPPLNLSRRQADPRNTSSATK